jgi:hypothetical protein
MRDHPTLHLYTNSSKGTWETLQQYTWTQIQVKEQLVVRKDIDVNEHERLSNITIGHKFK